MKIALVYGENGSGKSSLMTEDYLVEKAKKGSWDKFKQVLDKVSEQEPEDYDKL